MEKQSCSAPGCSLKVQCTLRYLAASAIRGRLINDRYSLMYNYRSNVLTHLLLHFLCCFPIEATTGYIYSCRTIDYYPNYSCLVFSTLLPFY